MLFGSFWFQDELCILFADTNVGKSILAVQIGDSISSGRPIGSFEMEAPPAPVLYFDFELSDKQFHKRYSSPAGNHPFHPNFFRAVFNPASAKAAKFATYEEYLNNELENAIIASKAKVVIIDNVTCLRYGTHAAAGALNLIRYLQTIKNTYQLSILVLAHTPKRNAHKPVTRNDLQGSKMLINFCDSAFAIGESQAVPGQRYLKQIKQRSSQEAFGAANVCLCTIEKPGSFLQFRFNGFAHEAEHLARYSEQSRKNTAARIASLSRQGFSVRKVAAQLGIPASTVFRVMKRGGYADVPMCECADGERDDGCVDEEGRCADVQVCECADKERENGCVDEGGGCADVQVCGGADEDDPTSPSVTVAGNSRRPYETPQVPSAAGSTRCRENCCGTPHGLKNPPPTPGNNPTGDEKPLPP
ncbi:MAG: AAA family ATPase [Mucilaginibacter sp.]